MVTGVLTTAAFGRPPFDLKSAVAFLEKTWVAGRAREKCAAVRVGTSSRSVMGRVPLVRAVGMGGADYQLSR